MNRIRIFFGLMTALLIPLGVSAQQRFEVPYDSNQRYLALRAVESQFYPAEKDQKDKAQIRADIVCQSLAKDDSFWAVRYTTARNIWFTFTGFKFYKFSQENQPTEIYDYPRCRTCDSDQTWRLFNSQSVWSSHYTHYFTSIICTNRKKIER